MKYLRDVESNMDATRDRILSIHNEYGSISSLDSSLDVLRKEAYKHRQLKSAKEHVKSILNVKFLANEANKHIEDNKLLLAHECALEMENCRNDILEMLGLPDEKLKNINDIFVDLIKFIYIIINK